MKSRSAFPSRTTPLSLGRPLAVLAVFFVLAAQPLQAAYLEMFSSRPVGRSLYSAGGEWKKFGTGAMAQPAGNTAILGSEDGRRFVSLRSVGDPQNNARAYTTVSLPVSEKDNRRLAATLRFVTPDSPTEPLTNINVAFNATRDGAFDPSGTLNMGIIRVGADFVFFFDFGNGNRVTSPPGSVLVKPHAWYRFSVELAPSTGIARFTVSEQTAPDETIVWQGSNAGLRPYLPQEYTQINLQVARPGSPPGNSRSADFSEIVVGL